MHIEGSEAGVVVDVVSDIDDELVSSARKTQDCDID